MQMIAADPKKHKDMRAACYKKNKAKYAASGRLWREKNLEICLAYSKQYYQANKEQHAVRGKLYAQKHKDRLRELAKHKPRNTEKERIHCANRRARKLAAGGQYTSKQINKMLLDQKEKCVYCLQSLETAYHIDHIKPLSKGGDNSIRNIQLLCKSCNLAKSSKYPFKFRQERGFLL